MVILFFEESLISKDKIYDSLIAPSNLFDETTKICLETIFGSLCIITKFFLETAERNFEMLDRLITKNPNCSKIDFKAIIMGRSNKTSKWKKNLTPEKRSLMMKWDRQSTAKQFDDFKMRRSEIRKWKNEDRLKKIKEAKIKKARVLLVKDKLCRDIIRYGGLWLSFEQVD